MAQTVTGVNPDILRWARETSGYSVSDVASVLKKRPEAIQTWEAGTDSPTYVQLETLAYEVYKRPIAIFFFPEVPEEVEPGTSFRTLPVDEIDAFSADTRLALRQARAMQLTLYELGEGANAAPKAIFRDIRLSDTARVVHAVTQVREYLGVSLNEQIAWRSAENALKEWRDRVQDCGVFVFKRALSQRDISGFSLLDEQFPVVYLNNSTPHTRQVFSLFHEMAHLLLGTNGVTKQDDSYIRSLSARYRGIEVFCNRFSAEFLVPSDDFAQFAARDFHDDAMVKDLAGRYHVSREVVLRRALETDLVDQDYYREKAREWARQAERARGKRSGGDYYATQATYLGSRLLHMAFSRYYQGLCTREQLADYLNVKTQSLPGLEPFALGGSGS